MKENDKNGINQENIETQKLEINLLQYYLPHDKIRPHQKEVKHMEEKLDTILNEISNIKVRMDILEKRLDTQGRKMDDNFSALDKKIDDTRLELTREIRRKSDELKAQIGDLREINIREHSTITEHFESLYQESKNDRKELHQNINDLSLAHKLNRMDIDKFMAKC